LLFPLMAMRTLPRCGHVALGAPRRPKRFAQMTPMLFRGAQPTTSQLTALRDLGIKTIVSFVDDPIIARAEVTAATALGIEVHHHPFSGLDAPDPALLRKIVESLRALPGPIYIHCRLGRDRTSLVAALYRVWVQGWDPSVAWRQEARDFGHRGVYAWLFRQLDRAYWAMTQSSAL
jgi:protein tyrosine/serine phosphatase